MVDCDLCGRGAKGESEGPHHRVTCPACGVFLVVDKWRAEMKNQSMESVDEVRLRGVVRRETDRKGKCAMPIDFDSAKVLIATHEQPSTPLQQMHRYILLAAERARHFGGESVFDSDEATAVRLYFTTDLEDPSRLDDDIRLFMSAVRANEFVAGPYSSDNRFTSKLTLKGWELAEQLRKTKRECDQGFVAMWFHPGMDSTFEKGIGPALSACGYRPYVVNRAGHNNKIDDEIVANIRKSSLVVADLTGVRPNVFYEAGFAHGLGVPLVLTCNSKWSGQYIRPETDSSTPATPVVEGWFRQVETHALDIRNYPLLGWSDPDDLRLKLYKRIHALALNLVPPRDEPEWR